MKKWSTLLLAVVLALGLVACGEDEEAAAPAVSSTGEALSASSEAAPAEEEETTEGGTLVAVFSRVANADIPDDVDVTSSASLNTSEAGIVGDTQLMAQTAVAATGGDLYLILTETPYPAEEDAVYTQAQQEQLDQARPALATAVENMDDYSTIILIYPNWWGGLPMPVCTFLESYDFSHKTLIPVCCYDAEESGAGNSRATISSLCAAYVTTPYTVRGRAAATRGTQTDFTNWLHDLPVNY